MSLQRAGHLLAGATSEHLGHSWPRTLQAQLVLITSLMIKQSGDKPAQLGAGEMAVSDWASVPWSTSHLSRYSFALLGLQRINP